MKRIIVLLFAVVLSLNALAQLEVRPGSFKEAGQFFEMRDDMTDDNYTPFAVIRVKTENMTEKQVEQLAFSGNAIVFIDVEYHGTEAWVYCTYLADYLKITHPDLSSTEFTLPFDMEPLKGYELVLVSGASEGGGKGSLSVTTNPQGAKVTLNGNVLSETTPCSIDMLGCGNYNLEVSKDKYYTSTQVIAITKDEETIIDVNLEPITGVLIVKSTPKGADVIIDGENYGKTPLTIDKMLIGEYYLDFEKNGNFLVPTKTILITENETLIVNETLPKSNGRYYALFSVSDTTKVNISKGNLQYKASTNTWRFAEHQWDYVGTQTISKYWPSGGNVADGDNAKISQSYNGWIDLFGWGTGDNPTKNSKDNSDYKTFNDWGNNTISNGDGRKWRTLTKEEWKYLFEKRITQSGIRYAKAKVNGVEGIILFPDNWRESYYHVNDTNDYEAQYTNTISQYDWNKLEARGAVFLPNAGFRSGNLVRLDIDHGEYASATGMGDDGMFFVWISSKWSNNGQRNYGCSVRLVSDVIQ